MRKKHVNLLYTFLAVFFIAPFLWSLLGSMSFTWVGPVTEVGVPVLIERRSFFDSEEGFKSQCGSFMFEENSGVQDAMPVGFGIIPQTLLGLKDSTLKLNGGFVEFCDLNYLHVSGYSESMFYKLPTQKTDNATGTENDSIIEIYWHPRALLLGFSIGGWLVIVVNLLCPFSPNK